jgi:hypothetical protein
MILDKLHIVRSSHDDRYGMFGDERKYVKSWEFNKTTGKSTTNLKSRKWWEYIFIEKSTFNF